MADAHAGEAGFAVWRQGDVVLDVPWFVHIEPGLPGGEPYEVVETTVRGLVALTQTCDILRDAAARPFVEFAPLVEIPNPTTYAEIERGARPNYAVVSALKGRRLVADLDRAMTLHKAVLETWARTPGWTTDDEIRAFAQALARKRVRFAFPDDFVELVAPLQGRVKQKHGKQSPEGTALRALREIRVRATPAWMAHRVDLFFLFLIDRNTLAPSSKPWELWLGDWLALIEPKGRFAVIEGAVLGLGAVSAEEYLNGTYSPAEGARNRRRNSPLPATHSKSWK